jgi:hypothetical protein
MSFFFTIERFKARFMDLWAGYQHPSKLASLQ